MDNYYDILGIQKTANSTQIRAAYKQLALRYHPDRNPGFPEAEEIFKRVNEAYHVLSDPVKKLHYDSSFILLTPYDKSVYAREMKRRRYWYYMVKNQHQPYKIDREYFRIQGLAFLVFIVISGFCFALVHAAQYISEQRHLRKYNANSLSLKKVNSLFLSGQYDDAFSLIESLHDEDPAEFRFLYTRDSLVTALRRLADQNFESKDFARAVSYYFKLEHHEQPAQAETLQRISLCQFYLGNYKEAVQAMKHLHSQDPRNLRLVYEIGIINLDYLQNIKEALQYFTLGKKLFDENLRQIYGDTFQSVVNPSDVPDIYFDIFEARARSNMALKNYEDAVVDCNWAVFLRPERYSGYLLRARSNAAMNQREKICSDIVKARELGALNTGDLATKFCERHY